MANLHTYPRAVLKIIVKSCLLSSLLTPPHLLASEQTGKEAVQSQVFREAGKSADEWLFKADGLHQLALLDGQCADDCGSVPLVLQLISKWGSFPPLLDQRLRSLEILIIFYVLHTHPVYQ